MVQRVRNFCFTLNNYTDQELEIIDTFECKYLVYGKEVGKEGTPHLQGYCELANAKTLKCLKKKFSDRAHIEPRYGTAQQASDYCKKDGKFVERGVMSAQGKRNDLLEIKEKIIEKKETKMSEILPMCNNYQQIKYAETLIKYSDVKRNWQPLVFWLWGATGTGKTRTAHKMAEMFGGGIWMSAKSLKWWDGYDSDDCVILDDFRADFCTYHELLRILDRYEYRIEIKGGSRQLLAHYIFITSPYHPCDVYKTIEDKKQLLRRINFILKFSPDTIIDNKNKSIKFITHGISSTIFPKTNKKTSDEKEKSL